MDQREFLGLAKQSVTEISVAELAQIGIESFDLVIDVREPSEHAEGAIVGSELVPLDILHNRISDVAPKEGNILLYCAAGSRSLMAGLIMQQLGYQSVTSLAGGYNQWEHFATHGASGLTATEQERYARHMVIEEIGPDGQAKLLNSAVLVVGAGGLGSPAGLYLAAAGVGKIGLVDDDNVELSNLQRQVAHTTDRVGKPKVTSAATTLDALNPDCDIRVHETRLQASNAAQIAQPYDVIIDATDNSPTRYLLNDVAILTGIPLVHGSIYRFEGRVTVVAPPHGPCYRCLFPLPPTGGSALNCAQAGVLGALPGVIGSMQSIEVIKLLLGIGQPLIGELATYDALDQSMLKLPFGKRADCQSCSNSAELLDLVDYNESCIRR